jgi:hypothetical protein
MIGRASLALLLLLSLTGCVTASSPPPETPSPVSSSPTSASSSPSDEASSPAWAPTGVPVDPADYAHPDGGVAFDSPSGNIHCFYSEYSIAAPWWGCLLDSQTVVLPPGPDGACTGTFLDGAPIVPNGLAVDPSEPDDAPRSFCAGAGPAVVLDYGASLSYRDMACDSSEDGMTCRSVVSGRGFTLSRSDYQLY